MKEACTQKLPPLPPLLGRRLVSQEPEDEELSGLSIKELRTHAAAIGVSEDAIEDARHGMHALVHDLTFSRILNDNNASNPENFEPQ